MDTSLQFLTTLLPLSVVEQINLTDITESGLAIGESGTDDDAHFSIFYNTYNLHSIVHNSVENLSGETNHTDVYQLINDNEAVIDIVKFLFQGVGITIFALLGIIGNIFSIIVLSNKRMRTSISCLLIGLAICDMIILFNSLFLFGLPTLLAYAKSEKDEINSAESFIKYGHLVPYLFGLSLTSKLIEYRKCFPFAKQ
jgi:hypothetical protein